MSQAHIEGQLCFLIEQTLNFINKKKVFSGFSVIRTFVIQKSYNPKRKSGYFQEFQHFIFHT
jgi:hypothetical protein